MKGSDTPTLVLLPGLNGTTTLFADFILALGAEVEVIPVAYPPDQALGYEDLEVLVRACLPLERPFFLLGESFSGPIAIAIAATPPANLQGVILSCSFVTCPRPWLALLEGLAGFLPVQKIPRALLQFFLLGRHGSTRHRAALNDALAAVSPSVLKIRAGDIMAVNVCVALGAVQLPLLYLRATEDRVVPRAAGEQVLALARYGRLEEFPGPHFLLQTLPEAVAQRVKAFMAAEQALGS